MTNEELWQIVLNEAEVSISRANFITWFKHTFKNKKEEGTISFSIPNCFKKGRLENKYHKLIMHTIRTTCPEVRSVEYVVSSVINTKNPQKTTSVQVSPPAQPVEEQLEFQELHVDKKTNLNPRYIFDTFIV